MDNLDNYNIEEKKDSNNQKITFFTVFSNLKSENKDSNNHNINNFTNDNIKSNELNSNNTKNIIKDKIAFFNDISDNNNNIEEKKLEKKEKIPFFNEISKNNNNIEEKKLENNDKSNNNTNIGEKNLEKKNKIPFFNDISNNNNTIEVKKEKIPFFNEISNKKNQKENNKNLNFISEMYLNNFKSTMKLNETSYSYLGDLEYKNFKLIFTPYENNINQFYYYCIYKPRSYNFSIFEIDKIKYLERKIQIYLKDKRIFEFNTESVLNFQTKIIGLINPNQPSNYFEYALYYKNKISNINYQLNGWEIYNIENEFYRQDLDFSKYKFTKLNMKYTICSTYPKILIIPFLYQENNLKNISNLRNNNRFPVLTYYYSNEKSSLWRSSQILYNNKTNIDMDYLSLIKNNNDRKINIIQLLSQNQTSKYDVKQSNKDYKFVKINLDNITLVRKNFKLYKKEKDNKNWMIEISRLIEISNLISKSIYHGIHNLIQSIDDFDITTQICSIVQILLDPYFRTIIGFAVLIEKEWISFGHPFSLRNGCNNNILKRKERSPIFIQFLFIIYQLIFQFPTAFEFNEELLIFLTKEIYTNKYGTFLFDCEKNLNEFNGKNLTVSIWSDVFLHKYKFYNNNYIKYNDKLNPLFEPYLLDPWKNFLNFYKKIGKCFINQNRIYKYEILRNEKENEGKAFHEIYNLLKDNKIQNQLSENTINFLSNYG